VWLRFLIPWVGATRGSGRYSERRRKINRHGITQTPKRADHRFTTPTDEGKSIA
jgi:hypothetical protein